MNTAAICLHAPPDNLVTWTYVNSNQLKMNSSLNSTSPVAYRWAARSALGGGKGAPSILWPVVTVYVAGVRVHPRS